MIINRESQTIQSGVEEKHKSQGIKVAYIMSRFPKLLTGARVRHP